MVDKVPEVPKFLFIHSVGPLVGMQELVLEEFQVNVKEQSLFNELPKDIDGVVQAFVPEIQAEPFQQSESEQVLVAQPLSGMQVLVPGIQVKLFQQVSVVQVVAAQELSAQS